MDCCVSFGVSLGVLLGGLLGVSFIRCVVVSRLVFL